MSFHEIGEALLGEMKLNLERVDARGELIAIMHQRHHSVYPLNCVDVVERCLSVMTSLHVLDRLPDFFAGQRAQGLRHLASLSVAALAVEQQRRDHL